MFKELFLKTIIYTLKFGSLGLGFHMIKKLLDYERLFFLGDLHQTIEDRSCSTHIIGTQGSGKTYWAMQLFIKDIKKGYGALWMSTQGVKNSDLLNKIPKERVKDVILLRPYSNKLLGINLLKTYTNTQLERSLVADSVVVLFKRLFGSFGDNMEAILTAGTLALLEYADKTNNTVSLWDLYILLSDSNYRSFIVQYVDNRAAFDMIMEIDDKENKMSLNALLRRFRKILYHDQITAFLSQKENDVDLLKAVKQRKIIICDFLAGGLGSDGIGKENSKFLAELIVSKFQLIAESRNKNSSLYPLYLDEFQTYTSTAENIEDFIDLNRQRRMPVILINQRRFQLPEALQKAVDSCGTKYIFQLNPNDWGHYTKMFPQYEDEIEKLEHRQYIANIQSYGKHYDFIATTPDIKDGASLETEIIQNNTGEYTVNEIMNKIEHGGLSKNIENDIFQ